MKTKKLKIKIEREYTDNYGQKVIVIRIDNVGYHINKTNKKDDIKFALYRHRQYLKQR